jgi:N-acetylneuraminic acid mutarotase
VCQAGKKAFLRMDAIIVALFTENKVEWQQLQQQVSRMM